MWERKIKPIFYFFSHIFLSSGLYAPFLPDRLFITRFDLAAFSQIEFGDAELPLEFAYFFQVNRADNVNNCKFLRIGRDDGQSDYNISLIFQVHLDLRSAAI